MARVLSMEAPRILIADDQSDVLEALQLLLKHEGFVIEVVSSPRAVCEAVEARRFDVLLLDLNYARDTTSGAEGLELLSRLQELDSTMPVVLMTAWGSIELAVEAMQNGGSDFIQKPWDNIRLLQTLRHHVERGRAARQKRRQENLSSHEMEEAREVQRRLLPSELPVLAGAEVHTCWRPASNVGGDYYDAIRLDNTTLAFCIADVSGKGLPAALLMSNVQATVRAFASILTSPAAMCAQINQGLAANTLPGKFVSLFYGVLDLEQRRLCYTNAGHVPPVLLRPDGTVLRLSEGGTVLGLFPDAQYTEGIVDFTPGDRIVLVTDGITEASDDNGEEFGIERLIHLLLANRGLPAAALQDVVMDAVLSFAPDGIQDDATFMVIA